MKEPVRDAVVTIQGGGVFGLSLLGQLKAVFEHGPDPIAWAGTSAGALIATLVWGKLNPEQIQSKFEELTDESGPGLVSLLANSESTVKETLATVKKLEALLERAESNNQPFNLPSPAGVAIGSPQLCVKYKQLYPMLKEYWSGRGLFTGLLLEQTIDAWLSEAPDVQERDRDTGERRLRPPGKLLTFGHFRRLMRENPPAKSYRPPLFLTTTNLSTGQLELINSVEERFDNVPVARAARASAGFPVVFTPVEIQGLGQDATTFVDGGVVSNFPSWVFTTCFRRLVRQSQDFRGIASRSWVHLGLRVVADPRAAKDLGHPFSYLLGLTSMLTGQARNQLEGILESLPVRSSTICQPKSKTSGPKTVVSFAALNKNKNTVTAMIEKGAREAQSHLKRVLPASFIRTDADAEVQKEFRELCRGICIIWGRTESDLKPRAAVFVPVQTRLQPWYQIGFGPGDPDRDLTFDLEGGLTGRAYTERLPWICNLEHVCQIAERGELDKDGSYNMTKEEHLSVRKDRTWLAATPIFDPFDREWLRGPETRVKSDAQAHYRVKTEADGGVLGVLDVDLHLNYATCGVSDKPEIHCTEPKVRGTIDLMAASASRLGLLLAANFKEETHDGAAASL
jgi:predicted acylesterase/phospholipase RssA